MFDFLRKRTDRKSLTVYLIFGAIIMVFVFFGYNTRDQGSTGAGFAVRVNNRSVSLMEYKDSLERLTGFYSQIFGPDFANDENRRSMVRKAALDQLVQQEALYQGATDTGLHVTDTEIKQFIVSVPSFQKEGRFQRSLYDNFLTYKGMSATQFEDRIRRDVASEKVRRFFGSIVPGTRLEVEREELARRIQINLEFLSFERETLTKKLTASESEVTTFKGSGGGQKKIGEYYSLNPTEFAKPLEVRARHILIKFEKGNQVSETAALEKIKGLETRLKNKEDFGSVAAKFSEDEGSKGKNGDLGFFSAGRMVPPFEQMAFSLKPGELSRPVKTDYGYHLILVEERREAKNLGLSEVEDSIARKLVLESLADQRFEEIRADLPKGDVKSSEKLAASLGLKWQETGFFGAHESNVPKLGSVDAVLEASLALNSNQRVFGQLVQDGPRSIVLRLKEKKETQNAESGSVANGSGGSAAGAKDVRQELTQGKSGDLYEAWTQRLVKAAKVERNASLVGEK